MHTVQTMRLYTSGILSTYYLVSAILEITPRSNTYYYYYFFSTCKYIFIYIFGITQYNVIPSILLSIFISVEHYLLTSFFFFLVLSTFLIHTVELASLYPFKSLLVLCTTTFILNCTLANSPCCYPCSYCSLLTVTISLK